MDRGAWWATVHGVTKSQIRLSNFTFNNLSIIIYSESIFSYDIFILCDPLESQEPILHPGPLQHHMLSSFSCV